MILRLTLLVLAFPPAVLGFLSNARVERTLLRSSKPPAAPVGKWLASSTSLSMANKLWDRMEIEEDEETMWYVLNCVAGLEIDLLRQCRQRCEDMEDVEKFVVPMITNTRSHGANRMVKDTKVKYQGYVFAKLRLCPKTYEAIQELDLCRSWMGTVNFKGHKKLPPAPVALNEDEIENFGLEDLESEEPEEPEEDDIILDTEEADKEAAEMEETVQTIYRGIRVGDMVKVTAKNKFFDEDAIVRRLKDNKLFLRFYTYGSMYEEWMEPGDVRKLSEVEVERGLSGPQEPITQRDIDGPEKSSRFGDDGRGPSRRNLVSNSPRNRRQDRVANRFRGDSEYDRRRNDENWNWYKDNESQQDSGRRYRDGDFDMRGSRDRNQRNNDWAQGDVDSQWGRTSQRQNRRMKREQRRQENDTDDWSAFVSSSPTPASKEETDDFFASLMTDLSKDMESEKSSKGGNSGGASSGEDDFFASLISEIEEDSSSPTLSTSDEDDFFASLEDDLRGSSKPKDKKAKSSGASDELDDFFSELGVFDEQGSDSTESGDGSSDFFASLESDLASDLNTEPQAQSLDTDDSGDDFDFDDFFSDLADEAVKGPAKSPPKQAAPTTAAVDASNLEKCTVPVLKDMLRERGLKVSGKKSELIERLAEAI